MVRNPGKGSASIRGLRICSASAYFLSSTKHCPILLHVVVCMSRKALGVLKVEMNIRVNIPIIYLNGLVSSALMLPQPTARARDVRGPIDPGAGVAPPRFNRGKNANTYDCFNLKFLVSSIS